MTKYMRSFMTISAVFGLAACDQTRGEGDISTLAGATKFDLVCDLHTKMTMPDASDDEGEQSTHLRIDLSSGRWCEGLCEETTDISAFDASSITLRDEKKPELASVELTKVNRESGRYTHTHELSDGGLRAEGNCIVIPFTGFPPRKF